MKMRILLVPLALAVVAGQACTAGSGKGGDGDGDAGDGDGGDGDLQVGDGDGDLQVGDGDTGGGPSGSDNLLGIPTNVILEPECGADCSGFSDGDSPLVVVEGTVDQASLDAGGTPDGICVAEPANGTIFPAAWTRPRFHVPGQTGPGKVTLSTPKMKHDFTMYVESMPAYLPLDVWHALSLSVYNEDITYTVVTGGGQATGTFQIAPVAAGGSMVFWGSTGTVPGERNNALYGFGVGDEGVIKAIEPGDIDGVSVVANRQKRSEHTTTEGHSTCVGCHSSTPDGKAIASLDHWPWNVRLYSIEPGTQGAAPDYLSVAGAAMIQMSWLGGTTFSFDDWAARKRMVTTWTVRDFMANAWQVYDNSARTTEPQELVWMDLEAQGMAPVDLARVSASEYMTAGEELNTLVIGLRGTGWDVIARNGDTNSAVLPDWSHDGANIVYTSTDGPNDGRVGSATAVDIYSVPFNDGAGGDATPVAGASSAENFEYYPDYSPDDALIAFNRIPSTGEPVYYRPESDIYVVASSGGTEARLVSNDAICGVGSAGQMYNSWAKWAPSSAGDGTSTYYFLIFSTTRNSPGPIIANGSPGDPASQLYMTTIIEGADGSITSSPATYLWNQRNLVSGEGDAASISELLTNNVTPAWDQFQIPKVPPVVVK